MKLDELRRLLGERRLKLQEIRGANFTRYYLDLGQPSIGLPTVVCLPQMGEAIKTASVKAVANSLGLSVAELMGVEEGQIGRCCVLLKYAVHLVNWTLEREFQGGNPAESKRGRKAIMESVADLLAYTARELPDKWNDVEREALHNCLQQVQGWWPDWPELATIAQTLTKQINL